MNRISLTIIGLLAFAFAQGANVVSTPGELAASLTGDVATVETLTVSGSVDARDLFYIAEKMPALHTLDLSGCTVAAYNGEPLEGKSSYAAATIPTGAFAGTGITTVKLPSPVIVGDMAFAGSALTSLNLADVDATLGTGCFAACKKLTSIKLGKGVKGGSYTFRDCIALTTASLGDIAAVGAYDFAGCTALSSVTSAGAIETIGDDAFAGCTDLQHFNFPASLSSIGKGAFMNTSLERADLSRATSLRSVGPWAFANDESLTVVNLPESASEIGAAAFFDCSALTSLDLPSSCTNLADYVLKDATALTGDMALPSSLQSVGNYSLKGVSGVTGIFIPGGVTKIGNGAMEGMTSLNTIDGTALTAVPELGEEVWAYVDVAAVRLDVKPDIADEFREAEQWQDFRINATDTGIDEAPVLGEIVVRGIYNGQNLSLVSTGAEIVVVDIYNLDGRLLAQAAPQSQTCTVDTSALEARIIAVRCYLADGTIAALKLAY